MNSHTLTRATRGPALLAGGVALLLLGACGGGGGSTPLAPSAPSESALSASAPGELTGYVKGKLRERQTQREQGAVFFTADALLNVPVATTGFTAMGSAVDRSGTTVQEAGVDEDDLIKSDGTHVFTLARVQGKAAGDAAARLQVHRRAADGTLVATGSLPVLAEPGQMTSAQGMLLAPDTGRLVAVIGESSEYVRLPNPCDGRTDCVSIGLPFFPQRVKTSVAVDIVSAVAPAAPVVNERLRIEGRLIGSRLIGNSLVLVTQTSPFLPVEALPMSVSAAERNAAIDKVVAADVLPTVRVNGGAARPLFAETDCWLQPKNGSYGIELTAITTIDLQATPVARRTQCFVGGSEALYISPTSLVLATTRYTSPAPGPGGASPAIALATSTDLHKFAFGASGVAYRGSGEVPGHLGWDAEKRSYRMGEWNGDLRVLTYTGATGWGAVPDASKAPSPATLTILRERTSDKTLQAVSTLPNAQRPAPLGKPGEQVYGVRLIGDRGYVVTFRQIDPLYVLDLSNPLDPRALGELEVAGFSDWLFPLGDDLLLGVGKDADLQGRVGGVKVALFDVANPAQMKQAGSIVLGESGSASGLDFTRHGIDLFRQGDTTRIALPLLVAGKDFFRAAGNWSQGLHRFEVDHATRTLVSRPAIPAPLGWSELSTDRALQIGPQVHYFSGGLLQTATW